MAAAETSAEELISRMGDDEVFGLTPPNSRPGTSADKRQGSKQGVKAWIRPPSAGSAKGAGSRPPSAVKKDDAGQATKQAQLTQSASAPVVGSLRPTTAKEVKEQRKESFHRKRQRRWLEIRNKQHCLSFTEQEISDFRRFFDALAEGKTTITLDRFEDMLVCLDLAKSRKDIRGYMDTIRYEIVNNEVTFDQFLRSFESQLGTQEGAATMDVLKEILKGTYDTRELDYLTFISERRRELIFSATGARGSAAHLPALQIVRTFSDLLEDRCYHHFGGSDKKGGEDGVLIMGGLESMWQVACVQHRLAPTLTAEERSANFRKSVPPSPRVVIDKIVRKDGPKTFGVHRMGHTVMIEADRISV